MTARFLTFFGLFDLDWLDDMQRISESIKR